MKMIKKVIGIFLVVGVLSACENLEMDGLQQNPAAPTPESASLNDLYNNIQLTSQAIFNGSEFQPGASSRMYLTVSLTYRGAITNGTMGGLWANAYNGLFPDVDALIGLAEGKNFAIHVGSAKILKAYTMMILVDLMGDVPYSEAGQGTDVISPTLDDDAAVYAAAVALLDEAIAELTGTNAPAPSFDNYYGGDPDGWIKAANSLKLRAALNMNDAAAFNALKGGNIITSSGDDFQYQFGNQRANPNSRHPKYNNMYETITCGYC